MLVVSLGESFVGVSTVEEKRTKTKGIVCGRRIRSYGTCNKMANKTNEWNDVGEKMFGSIINFEPSVYSGY